MRQNVALAGALALTLLASACKTTGGIDDVSVGSPNTGNGGGTPAQTYNALNVTKTGNQFTATGVQGSFAVTHPATGDSGTASITVGGQTYNFTGESRAMSSDDMFGHGDAYYRSFDGVASGDRELSSLSGKHSHVGMALLSNSQLVFAHGGDKTVTLPTQSAEYQGVWFIVSEKQLNPPHPDGYAAGGSFTGSANFSAANQTMALHLTGYNNHEDNPVAVAGTANFNIKGTGFEGTLNTTGGFVSNNTVSGQFYGSKAEEFAGTVEGSGTGIGNTFGYVAGHQ